MNQHIGLSNQNQTSSGQIQQPRSPAYQNPVAPPVIPAQRSNNQQQQPPQNNQRQTNALYDPMGDSNPGLGGSSYPQMATRNKPPGTEWQQVGPDCKAVRRQQKPKLVDGKPALGIDEDGLPYYSDFSEATNAYLTFVGPSDAFLKVVENHFGVNFMSSKKIGRGTFLVWVEHPDYFKDPEARQKVEGAFKFLFAWCCYGQKAPGLDLFLEEYSRLVRADLIPEMSERLPRRTPSTQTTAAAETTTSRPPAENSSLNRCDPSSDDPASILSASAPVPPALTKDQEKLLPEYRKVQHDDAELGKRAAIKLKE